MLSHSSLGSSTTLIMLRPISGFPTASTHSSSVLRAGASGRASPALGRRWLGPRSQTGSRPWTGLLKSSLPFTPFGVGGTKCSQSPSPNSWVSHLHTPSLEVECLGGPYPKRTPYPLHLISIACLPFREDKACVLQLQTEGLKCRSWRSSHCLVKEFPLRC